MREEKRERRPPGRPPREVPSHMVRVRMDRPVWETLGALAREQGTTASAILRECAARYIKRRGGD